MGVMEYRIYIVVYTNILSNRYGPSKVLQYVKKKYDPKRCHSQHASSCQGPLKIDFKNPNQNYPYDTITSATTLHPFDSGQAEIFLVLVDWVDDRPVFNGGMKITIQSSASQAVPTPSPGALGR